MDSILMEATWWRDPLLTLIAFVLGVGGTLLVVWVISKTRTKTLERDIQRQIDGAKKEADNIVKAARIDAAAEAIKKREEFSAEANQIRAELRETEMRLAKREDVLERQTETIQRHESAFKEREKEVERRLHNIDQEEQ